jgi:broad specificity phosphatase PhoE
MKTLYFMRHGESEFNKANKWVGGSTDSPLTKKGIEQAQEAGDQLKKAGITFDIVIASPLKRAIQTAEEVVQVIGYPSEKIHINEDTIERDFGSLEGKKQLVAATKYTFDESSIDRHNGVETLTDFQERVNEFLKYLYTLPEDNILLVGHGAFGRALRRAVNKEPITARGKVFHNAEFERLI